MKYFICSLDSTCLLGIPSEHTERLIPAGRVSAAVCEREGDEVFISIPALLKLKDPAAPHGLILKSVSPVKTVLLSPRIDMELEIPEGDIQSLPEVLADMLKFSRGAYFKEQNIILILDTANLMEQVP